MGSPHEILFGTRVSCSSFAVLYAAPAAAAAASALSGAAVEEFLFTQPAKKIKIGST